MVLKTGKYFCNLSLILMKMSLCQYIKTVGRVMLETISEKACMCLHQTYSVLIICSSWKLTGLRLVLPLDTPWHTVDTHTHTHRQPSPPTATSVACEPAKFLTTVCCGGGDSVGDTEIEETLELKHWRNCCFSQRSLPWILTCDSLLHFLGAKKKYDLKSSGHS